MNASANVHHMFKPDTEAMLHHLEHLFGGFLDGYHDGLIELAWTDTRPDKNGKFPPCHARHYGTDEFEELVEHAATLNSQKNCNVYIGAALRRPDTNKLKRSSDADAWCLTAIYDDLDDPGAATEAKKIYGALKPSLVVVTGRDPHVRAQLWWKLDEPIEDPAQWAAAVRGVVIKTNGDPSVCNPGRLMRLAGTIAWPVKEGRTAIELTSIAPINGAQATYNASQIASVFPPIMEASKEEINTSGAAYTPDGLFHSKLNDGRERYMRDTLAAVLAEFIGTTGAAPTAQELFDEAWPQYERKVDLTKPGRGQKEFADKCKRTVERFHAGRIGGMRTLDEAVATFKAKQDKWQKEQPRQEQAQQKEDRATSPSGRLLMSAADFVAGFTPPAYLIDGIMQRGYLYSLTARTGHGKTAVDMHIAQCIARGVGVLNREVQPGAVLFCAGENPDDIRARYLVLAAKVGFDPANIPFYFINGVIDIEASFERIKREAQDIPDLMLIIVDTAAAYFAGDDNNSNTQQVGFARVLRKLTTDLPTKPAVLVNCHPVKNAAKDNLLPMGGSAFLNEVDGNLTLWKGTDDTTELHWQGKFRGPEFEPITFKMETVTCDAVIDARGRLMPSVVARPIGEMELARSEAETETDENILLAIICMNSKLSMSALAVKAGWTLPNGAPAKAKVQRVMSRLAADKLVAKARGGKYRATKEGYREAGLEEE